MLGDDVIDLEAVDLSEVLGDIIQTVLRGVQEYRFTHRSTRSSSKLPIHFVSGEYLEGRAQSLVLDSDLRDFLNRHGLSPFGLYFLVGEIFFKLLVEPFYDELDMYHRCWPTSLEHEVIDKVRERYCAQNNTS